MISPPLLPLCFFLVRFQSFLSFVPLPPCALLSSPARSDYWSNPFPSSSVPRLSFPPWLLSRPSGTPFSSEPPLVRRGQSNQISSPVDRSRFPPLDTIFPFLSFVSAAQLPTTYFQFLTLSWTTPRPLDFWHQPCPLSLPLRSLEVVLLYPFLLFNTELPLLPHSCSVPLFVFALPFFFLCRPRSFSSVSPVFPIRRLTILFVEEQTPYVYPTYGLQQFFFLHFHLSSLFLRSSLCTARAGRRRFPSLRADVRCGV